MFDILFVVYAMDVLGAVGLLAELSIVLLGILGFVSTIATLITTLNNEFDTCACIVRWWKTWGVRLAVASVLLLVLIPGETTRNLITAAVVADAVLPEGAGEDAKELYDLAVDKLRNTLETAE